MRVWPMVKEKITDEDHRKSFGKDLVSIFIAHDIDTYDVDGKDSELDEIVRVIYGTGN